VAYGRGASLIELVGVGRKDLRTWSWLQNIAPGSPLVGLRSRGYLAVASGGQDVCPVRQVRISVPPFSA
jgi:hypothetical protein